MALSKSNITESSLSILESMALDMLAEGKTARQIGEALGITPGEAAKLAYTLLDREIITDVEQRRKLQVYRLEKIIEALWQRVMKNADRDDVRNLTDVLEKLNILMGLNKEQDIKYEQRMHQYQLERYMDVIVRLITGFMQLNPNLKTPDEWQEWTASQLEEAKVLMIEEVKEQPWQ